MHSAFPFDNTKNTGLCRDKNSTPTVQQLIATVEGVLGKFAQKRRPEKAGIGRRRKFIIPSRLAGMPALRQLQGPVHAGGAAPGARGGTVCAGTYRAVPALPCKAR